MSGPLSRLTSHCYDNAQFIFNVMQNYPALNLILDVRDAGAFDSVHLDRSINLPFDSELSDSPSLEELQRVMRGEVALFERRRRFMIFIVYDSPGIVFARELEFILRKAKCREVFILDEEFGVFSYNYWFLCKGLAVGPFEKPMNGYPSEIIPFKFYLGDHYHAADPVVMKQLEITHIVNATKSVQASFENKGVVYLTISLDDLETEDIAQYFEESFVFIAKALQSGRVLVHCARGVSRSVTIVIMFLMLSQGINYDAAYGFVKKHRSVALPNEGFVEQLKHWAALRGENNIKVTLG